MGGGYFKKKLLQNVGQFIKVDDITLNRSKGKIARVCINIDITKPHRGSLFIPILNQPRALEVPISYEGLHEVCAMCGSDAHEMETCPETPKAPIEVIVEKFGATKIHNENDLGHKSASSSSPPTEKWVTVAPKKRGRPFPLPKRKSAPKVVVAPASPTVRLVSSSSSPVQTDEHRHNPVHTGVSIHTPVVEGAVVPPAIAISHLGPAVPVEAEVPPVGPLGGATGLPVRPPALEPAARDTNRHIPSGSRVYVSSPASSLEGSDLEDEDVTMFLNFENDDDVQLSSKATKKRRLEEGDASSPS